MDLGLAGKTALVTGVASERGIGRAIALALAREGCNIACADIIYEAAEAAAAQVSALGRRALAVKVDQGDYDSVKACVDRANTWAGGIDILINNAALMTNVSLIKNMPVSGWDREMKVSLSGPFYFIKENLPLMMKRKWGRIINISSLAGKTGIAGRVGYCTAKAGLIGLTKAAALEGARAGVTVNVLLLGMVDSLGMRDTVPQKDFDTILDRIAFHRVATCEEIGEVAAFYASEQASYITGTEIIVDGGQTMLVLR
jgi:3-oxoacyl-[acyl-carrier protein] reductase